MTDSPVTLQEQDQARMAWRYSPLGYAWKFGGLGMPRHLRLLAEALVDCATGRCKRLIVVMPPRHGKSETISHYFPAWFLDLFPQLRLGLASYEATFASEWGYKVRGTIEENPQHLRVRVAEDFRRRDQWYTTEGGGMFTAGIGGPFVGRGFHGAIVDDPFKNYDEAFSLVYRDRAWNWWLSTLRSRLEPDAFVIVTMQRWHEDDLVGRLLEQDAKGEGEGWRVLRLPGLAEEGDPLGRLPGEALWPERYNRESLERTRINIGSYLFNAQYQQSPSPAQGSILKRQWWRFYNMMPNPLRLTDWLQSWDMAFKDLDTSSYVVGQVWARDLADKYLIDQVRDRMDFMGTLTAVRNLTSKHPKAITKLVEDKANGPAVISTLRKEIPGLIAVEPEGSKVSRAYAVVPEVEAGNIYLPAPELAPWVRQFIEEAARFPLDRYDDQVDAFTQAIIRYRAGGISSGRGEDYRDQRLQGRR